MTLYRDSPIKSAWKNGTATQFKPYDILEKECPYSTPSQLMDCVRQKLYHQGDEFELEGVVLRDLDGANSSWEVKYRGGAYGACHTFHYPHPTGTNPEEDGGFVKFSEKLSYNVYLHDPKFFHPTANPSTFPSIPLSFNGRGKMMKIFYIQVISIP